MPSNPEEFNSNQPNRSTKYASFNGMKGFVKNLEKHFFSDIYVKENSPKTDKINLVIELQCNLSLIEVILHYDMGNWGTYNQTRYSLSDEIKVLERMNGMAVDVDELTIILNDTSIIIDKIYNHSISDQLITIFNELGKQYLQFTNGNMEVPYEIFVAIYEEVRTQSEFPIRHRKKTENYCNYWALYFESEADPVIYDLKNSQIIYEDLYMINK